MESDLLGHCAIGYAGCIGWWSDGVPFDNERASGDFDTFSYRVSHTFFFYMVGSIRGVFR
jgi:hypothetical protein